MGTNTLTSVSNNMRATAYSIVSAVSVIIVVNGIRVTPVSVLAGLFVPDLLAILTPAQLLVWALVLVLMPVVTPLRKFVRWTSQGACMRNTAGLFGVR